MDFTTRDGKAIRTSTRVLSNTIVELTGPLDIKAESRFIGTPMTDISFAKPSGRYDDQVAVLTLDLATLPALYEAIGAQLREHTNWFEIAKALDAVDSIAS